MGYGIGVEGERLTPMKPVCCICHQRIEDRGWQDLSDGKWMCDECHAEFAEEYVDE